jgi:hypothetical protein
MTESDKQYFNAAVTKVDVAFQERRHLQSPNQKKKTEAARSHMAIALQQLPLGLLPMRPKETTTLKSPP